MYHRTLGLGSLVVVSGYLSHQADVSVIYTSTMYRTLTLPCCLPQIGTEDETLDIGVTSEKYMLTIARDVNTGRCVLCACPAPIAHSQMLVI